MNFTAINKTGHKLSELGFGCGGFWGYKVFDHQTAIKIVEKAYESGINLFDSGISYSNGNAEIRMGEALKPFLKDPNLIFGTKVGTHLSDNGKLYKDFSYKALRTSLEKSLKNLNVDHIPLVQLHSPSKHHLTEDVFRFLEDIKKEGLVSIVGASIDGTYILDALELYKGWDIFMISYSMIKQHQTRYILQAKKQNITVACKAPLGHSLYSNRILKVRSLADFWYLVRVLKNHRKDWARGRKFQLVNDYSSVGTSHQIALKYVVDQPFIDCAVIGTTRIQNLESNVASIHIEIPTALKDQIINISKELWPNELD